MRVALAGLSFEIEAADELSADELAFCQAHAAGHAEGSADFTLRVEPGWPPGLDRARFADRAPAHVEAGQDSRLLVSHRRFVAELNLAGRRGTLHREPQAGGLAISLRVALSALLPDRAGLPLHAAGVVLGGMGLAFFGVSGAGKSSLAVTAAGTVLSDELVVLRADPWRVLASGFWGELELGGKPAGAPLRALFELAKTARFELEALAPREALRRLLASVLVPPDPALWSRALLVAARLSREVPVYRLGYALGTPPWEDLSARLTALQPLDASA